MSTKITGHNSYCKHGLQGVPVQSEKIEKHKRAIMIVSKKKAKERKAKAYTIQSRSIIPFSPRSVTHYPMGRMAKVIPANEYEDYIRSKK